MATRWSRNPSESDLRADRLGTLSTFVDECAFFYFNSGDDISVCPNLTVCFTDLEEVYEEKSWNRNGER